MRFQKIFRVGFLLLVVITLGSTSLFAQLAESAQKIHPVVKYSQNVVSSGDAAAVAILLNIKKGWHVNAHIPHI